MNIQNDFLLLLLVPVISVTLISACTDAKKIDVKTPKAQVKKADPSDPLDSLFGKDENEPKTIVSKPESFKVAVFKAQRALKQDKYAEAIQYAEYAIKFRPNESIGYYLRARANHDAGFSNGKQSLQDLHKAESLGKLDSYGYEMLSNLYATVEKDKPKALKAISKAIELDPDDKYIYQIRASYYSEVGKMNLAIKDLDRFIELAPHRLRGYVVRAKYQQSIGRDKEALSDYTRAKELALKEEDIGSRLARGEVLKLRATLLSKMKRYKEAMDDLTLSVKDNPDADDAYRLRGDLYFKLKEYDKAIDDYTASINISPQYARAALEARAKAYRVVGKDKLAEADRIKAEKLSSKRAEKPIFEMK